MQITIALYGSKKYKIRLVMWWEDQNWAPNSRSINWLKVQIENLLFACIILFFFFFLKLIITKKRFQWQKGRTSWINARNFVNGLYGFFIRRMADAIITQREWLPRTTLIHDNYTLNIDLMQFIRICRIFLRINIAYDEKRAAVASEWIFQYFGMHVQCAVCVHN